MSTSVDAWELSKENVLPIKRGRSVKGLNDTLAKSDNAVDKEALKLQVFEKELATKHTDEELIEHYLKYEILCISYSFKIFSLNKTLMLFLSFSPL